MKILSIRWWLLLGWLGTAVLGNVLFEIGSYLHLFAPTGEGIWGFTQLALPLFLLLFPALVVGWFIEWMVLRPLAVMSHAAQQIAAGNLEFYLPPAHVREVAEVFMAFDAMEHALRTSLGRQANLEQERRLFISAIAHDLRTPLFALRGYLEGLAQGIAATPEKTVHYLTVCQEQANLLEQRIANLFTYARLEYLEQTPQREPLDLWVLIEQTVERFRPHLEAKNINIHLSGIEPPCNMVGDSQLLTRVFENLFDNAIRYSPSGGIIKVQLGRETGQVVFTVADPGPGIVPADLPHLFTPLYRSEISMDKTFANNTGGAGLGLTIAKQILSAHGGGLIATNGTAGGAEFRGWLPISEGGT